jgi:hypothetical protein
VAHENAMPAPGMSSFSLAEDDRKFRCIRVPETDFEGRSLMLESECAYSTSTLVIKMIPEKFSM